MTISGALGIFGNVSVVAAWLTQKPLRTHSNIFLINLAISDIGMLCSTGIVSSAALLMVSVHYMGPKVPLPLLYPYPCIILIIL